MAQKHTRRYVKIRGDFSVCSVWNLLSRKGAKGREDLWAHRIHGMTQNFLTKVLNWRPQNESKNNNFQTPVFQLFTSLLYRRTRRASFCTQTARTGADIYGHTEYTEWHRICSTYLHVSTRNISHAKTQRGAEIYEHTEYTEWHRFFWQKKIRTQRASSR